MRGEGGFNVFFYGSYIPLQGIEHVLKAAEILQDQDTNVHFTLVGSGQLYASMRKLADELRLRNVTFKEFVPLQELPKLMGGTDLCLGIFAETEKAKRVIPHKVYDAVAMGIPVITMDSPAIREKFATHPNVLLIPAGNPQAIAEKILQQIR